MNYEYRKSELKQLQAEKPSDYHIKIALYSEFGHTKIMDITQAEYRAIEEILTGKKI